MISLVLKNVDFQVQAVRNEEGELVSCVVGFRDPESGIDMQIPFGTDAWITFKRHVEADGQASPILVARGFQADSPPGPPA